MAIKFTNEEYTVIHFVCGFCNGNGRKTVEEYSIRLPDRIIPSREVFTDIYRKVRERECLNYIQNGKVVVMSKNIT